MLNDEARTAVALLAEAVRGLRPLTSGIGGPVRVPVPAPGVPAARTGVADPLHTADPLQPAALLHPADLLTLLADRLQVALSPEPGTPRDALGVFERVVGQRLEPALHSAELTGLRGVDRPEVTRIADRVAARSFDRLRTPEDAVAGDGARLPVYTAGDPAAPPVLLASACGMPAELCATWLEFLGREHYAVTWETRGLFGEVPDFDRLGWDTEAQSDDVFAVMDHLGLARAQLLGFCGGSVVCLHAAGRRPERVTSLSLWHGAYELGAESPKLDHHRNIQALMAMAAEGRDSAAAVHSVFLQTMLGSTPPDLAHLVLYPFATAELFYRYCRLNGAITDIDVNPLLPRVRQRTLVVTSEDDTTANPLGSAEVARRLANATLQVEPHGDHISLFGMGGRLGDLALNFTRDVPTGAGVRH